jgi:hypothetical protein
LQVREGEITYKHEKKRIKGKDQREENEEEKNEGEDKIKLIVYAICKE